MVEGVRWRQDCYRHEVRRCCRSCCLVELTRADLEVVCANCEALVVLHLREKGVAILLRRILPHLGHDWRKEAGRYSLALLQRRFFWVSSFLLSGDELWEKADWIREQGVAWETPVFTVLDRRTR